MSAARGRSPKTPASKPAPPEQERLRTSEDLFGDMVDASLPPSTSGRASRKEPIRVQVSDPASAPPHLLLAPDTAAGSAAEKEVESALARLGGETPEPAPAQGASASSPDRLGDLRLEAGTDPAHRTGPAAELDLASLAESGFAGSGPGAGPAPAANGSAQVYGGAFRDVDFGPYRLIERIAVGGMAEVFKAKRGGVEGFEKIVAVKRILPHLSDNKEFVDMFVDEAKMVARLSHPNIVQIFDLGRIEGSYYIAMEYVHGHDLRTIERRAAEKGLRMPLDLGLQVVSQVCAALEHAHRKKDEGGRPLEIVHRDVSPQNILISFEGDVKLVDFGIAKAVAKAASTDRGSLRGKLLYMSPEQAWGRPIDRRSDVFSLGIVLYELVTESKPFAVSDSELTILELVRQCLITPPREVNPRVPEALDRVIMKALAREPDERYQDAGQMQRGLERFLRERPPVSARDLARFLELLFERPEREESGAREEPSAPRPATGAEAQSLESLLDQLDKQQ